MNLIPIKDSIATPTIVVKHDNKENAFPYRSLKSILRENKPFDESRVFRTVVSVEARLKDNVKTSISA